MRTWVEKLAKISKEKGIRNCGQVRINALSYKWHLYTCDGMFYVYIDTGTQTTSIKIYQDEYDLLSKIEDLVTNNTEDNIIESLENL